MAKFSGSPGSYVTLLRSSRAAGAEELWQATQFFWMKASAPAKGSDAAPQSAADIARRIIAGNARPPRDTDFPDTIKPSINERHLPQRKQPHVISSSATCHAACPR